METMTPKLITAGILFLLTLISGLVVSNSSRPLNGGLITIHKLIAVSTVILLGMAVYQLYKNADGRGFAEMSTIISGILFLAMIATGALLTREEMQLPEAILKVHQIVPLPALVFSSTTIFLLIKGRS